MATVTMALCTPQSWGQCRSLSAFSEKEPSCFCHECIYYTNVLRHFSSKLLLVSSSMKGEKVMQVTRLTDVLGAWAVSLSLPELSLHSLTKQSCSSGLVTPCCAGTRRSPGRRGLCVLPVFSGDVTGPDLSVMILR